MENEAGERKRGEKSAREENNSLTQILEMLIREKKEDRKQQQEWYEKQAERDRETSKILSEQKAMIEELRKQKEESSETSSTGGLSITATSQSELSDLHRLMQKDNSKMESSKGIYKSDLLEAEGVNLPEGWPMYRWPKAWGYKVVIARALITMSNLQEQHLQ